LEQGQPARRSDPRQQIVWVFNNWKAANCISAAQLLDEAGVPERAELQR